MTMKSIFTFIILISSSAWAKPSHLNDAKGFQKLRSCYDNAQWKGDNFSHGSRFLKPLTVYMHQRHEYNALVIPKVTSDGKPQLITIQPGDFRSFTADSTSIGSQCEFDRQNNYTRAPNEPMYYEFKNNYFNFYGVLNSSCYNTSKKRPCRTKALLVSTTSNNFRVQSYKDAHGQIQFCEDVLKTKDHKSENVKDWQKNSNHFKKEVASLNLSEANKAVNSDLVEKFSKMLKSLQKIPSQKLIGTLGEEADKLYSAVSTYCKGFDPKVDALAKQIESLLLSSGYDNNLNLAPHTATETSE